MPLLGIGSEICRGALIVGRPFLFPPLRSEILLLSSDMILDSPEGLDRYSQMPEVKNLRSCLHGEKNLCVVNVKVVGWHWCFKHACSGVGVQYSNWSLPRQVEQ